MAGWDFHNEEEFLKYLPQYLYHATYEPALSKIKKYGLGANIRGKKIAWKHEHLGSPLSKKGITYFANSEDVAISFAETSEDIPEKWLDQIIVLKVNTDDLDTDQIFIDVNNQAESPEEITWEYHDVIPWSKIEVLPDGLKHNPSNSPKKLSKKQKALLQRVADYYSKLPNYQPKTVGKLKLTKSIIPAGEDIIVTSFREAIFSGMGIRPFTIKFPDRPIQEFLLSEQGIGVWMTTGFQELAQMDEVVQSKKIGGHVLIGGLGLGVIATLLNHKPNVTSVTVVERNKSLIKLIQPFLDPNIKIVHRDLFSFLKTMTKDQFDSAYFDIWQGTGEAEWVDLVVPIYRLARQKIKSILCWQEKTMQGQVSQALLTTSEMPSEVFEGTPGVKHYWVFRKTCDLLGHPVRLQPPSRGFFDKQESAEMTYYQQKIILEQENQTNYPLLSLIRIFLQDVGSPLWEDMFGRYWDQG